MALGNYINKDTVSFALRLILKTCICSDLVRILKRNLSTMQILDLLMLDLTLRNARRMDTDALNCTKQGRNTQDVYKAHPSNFYHLAKLTNCVTPLFPILDNPLPPLTTHKLHPF